MVRYQIVMEIGGVGGPLHSTQAANALIVAFPFFTL